MQAQTITQKPGPLQTIMSANPLIYISGPMTGLPEMNAALFTEAEAMLTRLGAQPKNPHKIVDFSTLKPGATDVEVWNFCMKQDLKVMYDCGGLVMLPNWAQSIGATWEFLNAKTLKMPVFELSKPDFSQESPEFNVVNLTEIEYVELFYKVTQKIKEHDSYIIKELNS